MKEQVTITRVFRGEQEVTDKKTGAKKKIPKLAIKTDKHGDKWLSTFKVQGTEAWKDGDSVEIFIEEKNGFINFSLNPKGGVDTSGLELRIKALEDKVFGTSAPAPEVDPDDF